MATPIPDEAGARPRAGRPRVALTRPRADAERSAALLRARGFEPVIVPAAEIAATGAQPADARFDALLATSANAFAGLDAAARASLAGLRVFVAGARTAAAARAAGLAEAEATGADAAALAGLVAARLARPSRLLYLAGVDRKSALESTLAAEGHELVTIEVYRARARESWSAAESARFAACDAALHYSRRSAALAIALAQRAGQDARLREMLNACLSEDAAAPLRIFGAERMVIAAGAQESLLIDALCLAVQRNGSCS